jgi:hypothetical protein
MIFISFNCSKETGCVEITKKENNGSTYLFYWDKGITANSNIEDEYSFRAVPSGAVTKEIYNKYEVGDTYCVD